MPVLFPQSSINDDAIRYFSLARYALLEGLRLLGVGKGQRVLLPSFICRDVLASVALADATPCWYDVTSGLTPASPPELWPEAEAVLAVNFFGFAQDLAPFEAYARRTGAAVIEDNAHGYLSRDPQGRWLGTRAPMGLLSIRKTFRIPDGAALVVNDSVLTKRLPGQVPIDGGGLQSAQSVKARLRRVPFVGSGLLRMATALVRAVRKHKTGSELPLSDPLSESTIPFSQNPWAGLMAAISRCDAQAEIARRRAAYLECAREGARYEVVPVFPSLPEHCVPYGYAFRSEASAYRAMQRVADRMGFDLVTWPDLPGIVRQTAPVHYHNVHLINFLW